MIEESGTVVALEGDEVWVQTIRQSSCGSCSARKGCGQGALASITDGRANQVRVRNTCGAGVGDHVVLGIEESQLLRASLLVYALPLLGLLVGALVGAGLWPGLDLAAIASGGLGLTAGFVTLKVVSGGRGQADYLRPVLLRIDLRHVAPEPLFIRDPGALNP
ncbi:alginate biosynthesis regulator MucC [Marinobacter nanhaiticus D15-8W]|uniref:Sigma E positive regulator RseC/MucC n=1 Tax=Marinobacter nanhaiticus D15-8W TaxID=626887 RepID=N6W8W7_9GAMM|nr:SoxR reducing system RseC family protein [Marinobacter nanhaiticus]ENO16684.1 sigma E positive regulator RseC/MucC [Marinobacter nanhaiticus D15-8W]BES72486.1 alginate biosynthesis regulator MucC [Marinobacter nanhaiticus D15-8W]